MASPIRSERTGPTRLPAPRRRQQLLDVATNVFAVRGFHGTSMDDVAEAAGVTKPVLYQHFSSKRELYRELLDQVGSQLVEAVTKAVLAIGRLMRTMSGIVEIDVNPLMVHAKGQGATALDALIVAE